MSRPRHEIAMWPGDAFASPGRFMVGRRVAWVRLPSCMVSPRLYTGSPALWSEFELRRVGNCVDLRRRLACRLAQPNNFRAPLKKVVELGVLRAPPTFQGAVETPRCRGKMLGTLEPGAYVHHSEGGERAWSPFGTSKTPISTNFFKTGRRNHCQAAKSSSHPVPHGGDDALSCLPSSRRLPVIPRKQSGRARVGRPTRAAGAYRMKEGQSFPFAASAISSRA